MAEILTKKGEVILVDDADLEWLSQYTWSVNPKGYAVTSGRSVNGKQPTLFMHRLIMNAPAGMLVDHINHLRHDNRRSNLRIVTAKENQNNQLPPRKMSTEVIPGKHCLLRGIELIGIYDTYAECHQAWIEAAHGGLPLITNTTIPMGAL